MKTFCMFLIVNLCLKNVFCWSTAYSDNTSETSTVESSTGVGDYLLSFLESPECGQFLRSTRKVVGGATAKLGMYPWMALLGYNTKRGRAWKCGGSLISVRHVLTAAHCIYNYENSLYDVRLGELDYNREDDGAHPVDIQIKTMISHDKYDPNTSCNDIGLLVLQRDVDFTSFIRPICIPTGRWMNETFENEYAEIAGWGRTAFGGTPASHLQFVRLPIRNNSVCARAFRKHKGRVVDDRVLCGGYDEGGYNSCGGDSGGPLMLPLKTDGVTRFFVTGVIAHGLQCGYFSVYTRVTHFLPWIEEKVLGRVTN